MPITVSTAIADLLDSANAPAALTALGAEAAAIRRSTLDGAPINGTTPAAKVGQECHVGDDPLTAEIYIATVAGTETSVWVGPYSRGTLANILNLLKGQVGNPARIGAEHLPAVVEFEYLLPGISLTELKPEGAITRKGSTLYIHDNVTPGGNPVGASPIPTEIRIIGAATITSSSDTRIKQNSGTYLWARLADITIPKEWLVPGTKIAMSVDFFAESSIVMLARSAGLVTTSAHILGGGSLPGSNSFNNSFQILNTSTSTKCHTKAFKVNTMTDVGGTPTLGNAEAGSNRYGYDYTVGAATPNFTGVDTSGVTPWASNFTVDAFLSLIAIYKLTTTVEDPVRTYAFDLTLKKLN